MREAFDHGSWLPASVGLRVTPLAALNLPSRDLVEFQTAVSCAMHADYERHLDTLAVVNSIAALAADAHVVAMALAPVVALLAEDAPDTGWGVHAEQLAEVSV